jgi:hypothetical protein
MTPESVWFVEWSEDGGKTWERCDNHDATRKAAKDWALVYAREANPGVRYRVSEYRRVEPNEGGK